MHEAFILLGACITGCFLGILTGLAPGIHVNTLLPFIALLPVSGRIGASLIFSLAVTHTFLDFVPSTLFGVCDTETALSVLPAHRLLLSGRGYEALRLTVVGSLGALLISCILVVPMVWLIPVLCRTIQPFLGYVLLFFVAFMVVCEKSFKRILMACGVFLLSGVYGYIVFSTPFVSEDLELFPVFCGLFGLSTLLLSLRNESELPLQSLDSHIFLKKCQILLSIAKGAAAGILVSLFPGIGPAHATAVISVKSTPRQFLVAASGVNTANTVYALVALYTVGKARSGAVLAIQNVLDVDWRTLLLLLSCSLVAAGISSVAALHIGTAILKILPQINYQKLMASTCVAVTFMVWVITGGTGLIIMAVGCCIGFLPPLMGIRRSHCMGVLLFPILLYYIFL